MLLWFKFRWKKPKDWKNSLKITMTTETTQNTTGYCLHAHQEVLRRYCSHVLHLSSLDITFSFSGVAPCRSDFVTGKRRPNWTSETGRGRRRNWRRLGRGFWLKATLILMLSCRGWVSHCVFMHKESCPAINLVSPSNFELWSIATSLCSCVMSYLFRWRRRQSADDSLL